MLQCSQEKQNEKKVEEDKDDVPRPFFKSPQKDTLIYTEAQKTVEFEADGRLHKFSIYDALSLVSKEDYEASLPPEIKERQEKKEEEPQTPVIQKVSSKKGTTQAVNIKS